MPEERQLNFTTMGGEVVTVPRRSKHYVQQRGYAYPPGTGPVGETCGSCRLIARFGRFRKCRKYQEFKKWTHGPGTDVLAGAAACKFWERET